jgi:CheY-like chemotaxis protein
MSQKVVKLMLEKLNYVVVTANDGKEAEELYFKNPSDFFLLLLDCQMPVQNGTDTAEHIRKYNKKVPIVMLTAHTTTKDEEECMTAGANVFLTKPTTMEILQKALQQFQTHGE